MSIEHLARPEILAMRPYSSARSEASARGILLNANEMPAALLENGPADDPTGINRYPAPQPADVINKLAALYSMAPENLLVTRGSDEGIDLLLRVFCRAGVDAILECPPDFGMYRIAAQTQGAALVRVERRPEDDFRLDINALLTGLRAENSVKLVFLTSPNNPTGDLVERADLLRVLEQTAGNALVVLDEAYVEFCPQSSAIELLDQFDHLVILRTLSKAWAAAGLRCGSVLANPGVIALLRRVMAPYPLAAPVVNRVRQLLDPAISDRQQDMIRQILVNKARLVSHLEGLPYIRNIWPGAANFVLVRLNDAEDLLAFCAANGIAVRGFSSEPLLRDCIRISVGTTDEIDALAAIMTAWGEQR